MVDSWKKDIGITASRNMNQNLKADLLPKLQAGYVRRGRAGKTGMLDELCEDYGYERK